MTAGYAWSVRTPRPAVRLSPRNAIFSALPLVESVPAPPPDAGAADAPDLLVAAADPPVAGAPRCGDPHAASPAATPRTASQRRDVIEISTAARRSVRRGRR